MQHTGKWEQHPASFSLSSLFFFTSITRLRRHSRPRLSRTQLHFSKRATLSKCKLHKPQQKAKIIERKIHFLWPYSLKLHNTDKTTIFLTFLQRDTDILMYKTRRKHQNPRTDTIQRLLSVAVLSELPAFLKIVLTQITPIDLKLSLNSEHLKSDWNSPVLHDLLQQTLTSTHQSLTLLSAGRVETYRAFSSNCLILHHFVFHQLQVAKRRVCQG